MDHHGDQFVATLYGLVLCELRQVEILVDFYMLTDLAAIECKPSRRNIRVIEVVIQKNKSSYKNEILYLAE